MITAASTLLRGEANPDRIPVRRHSRLAGREGLFWQRTSRRDTATIVLAAKRYELVGRPFGKRTGPLGHVAIEVIDYLAHLVDYSTGRLDPSIDTLMAKLKRSRDAIVRALAALRQHGFLDWLRRYVPTGNAGKGPQVQQTSNAYRLCMPARALRLLGREVGPPPIPDDHAHAHCAMVAQRARWRALLPLDARALDAVDGPLGEALARLGKGIMQRESGRQTESASGLDSIGGASLPAGK